MSHPAGLLLGYAERDMFSASGVSHPAGLLLGYAERDMFSASGVSHPAGSLLGYAKRDMFSALVNWAEPVVAIVNSGSHLK